MRAPGTSSRAQNADKSSSARIFDDEEEIEAIVKLASDPADVLSRDRTLASFAALSQELKALQRENKDMKNMLVSLVALVAKNQSSAS